MRTGARRQRSLDSIAFRGGAAFVYQCDALAGGQRMQEIALEVALMRFCFVIADAEAHRDVGGVRRSQAAART